MATALERKGRKTQGMLRNMMSPLKFKELVKPKANISMASRLKEQKRSENT